MTGTFMLAAPFVATPSGAVTAHSKVPTLLSLVVPGPAGFDSDATDETGGGPTGKIGFSEAASADCDPAGLTQGQWIGSVLRYFDNNPTDPETYVILCVTQLRSAKAATANRNRVAALDFASAPAGLHVPGAHMRNVGPGWQFAFSRSNYFVWVVGVSATNQLKGLAFATNTVRREYARLPK